MVVAAPASLVQRWVLALRSVAVERLVSVRCLLPAARCVLAAPQLPLVAVVVALKLREALRRVPEARSTNVSHVFSLRTSGLTQGGDVARPVLRVASLPFSTGDSKAHSVHGSEGSGRRRLLFCGISRVHRFTDKGDKSVLHPIRITHSCRDVRLDRESPRYSRATRRVHNRRTRSSPRAESRKAAFFARWPCGVYHLARVASAHSKMSNRYE